MRVLAIVALQCCFASILLSYVDFSRLHNFALVVSLWGEDHCRIGGRRTTLWDLPPAVADRVPRRIFFGKTGRSLYGTREELQGQQERLTDDDKLAGN